MVHPEIQHMKLFHVGQTDLDWAIGLRGAWKPEYQNCLVRQEEFTVQAVQRDYRGDLCYRVVADSDIHKFGMPAHSYEIEIFV